MQTDFLFEKIKKKRINGFYFIKSQYLLINAFKFMMRFFQQYNFIKQADYLKKQYELKDLIFHQQETYQEIFTLEEYFRQHLSDNHKFIIKHYYKIIFQNFSYFEYFFRLYLLQYQKPDKEKMKTKWRFTTTALKREIKNKKKNLEVMLQETVKLSNKFDFDNDPEKKYFEFQQIVKSKFKCSRAKHPSWTSFIATVFISFKLEVKKKHLSIFYKIVEFGQSCKQCSPKKNQYEKILMTYSSMKRLVKLFFFYVKKAHQNEWESKQQSIYCQPIPDAKNHLKKLCEACNAGVCPGLPENDCSESEDNDFVEISSSQSQIESFEDESDI